MKKILTVSLFAMMAVSAANADIASTKYVDDIAKTKQASLGFTPEDVANKVTSVTSASTNTQYPSAQAVYQYVSGKMEILNGNNNKLSGRVESLESAVTAKGALQDVVGNADSGLVKDVADLKTNKEAIANKLTSTAATTVSDTNKDTLYPTVGKVQSMINALDVTDAAQTGKYVSAVSEADGKIKVTRATLPTVNDATLTIKKNGTSVGTFTANASAAKEIDIKVPTKVSELTNDSDYATKTEVAAKEASANKLTSTSQTAVSDTNKDTLFPSVGKVQSMINALDVADAAQTGKYVSAVSEADGKIKVTRATLPTVNDATLTIKKNGTSVGTFTANASAAKEIDIKVPTKVSELTNDSSYATTGAMTTELNKKEATANKLTSTASTVISDTNKDTFYPSVGKVQLMVNERQMKSTAMSLGTTNGGWINLTDDATTGWVTSKCNQDGVTCSLVSKNGSIKWEKVTY